MDTISQSDERIREGGVTAREGGVLRERGPVPREGGVTAREGGSNWKEIVRAKMVDSKITPTVLDRGVKMFHNQKVHQSKFYPWIFSVVGDTHQGNSLYEINAATGECSCMYFINRVTQKISCKHIAAIGMFLVSNYPETFINQ